MENLCILITSGMFSQAYQVLSFFPHEEQWTFLREHVMFEEEGDDKSTYSFLLYCFSYEENPVWHYRCHQYLTAYKPLFDDCFRLASWHLTEAIRLAPDNIQYKQAYINDFWTYPVKYVPLETFLTYANDVIRCFPKDKRAREILKSQKQRTLNKFIRRMKNRADCE